MTAPQPKPWPEVLDEYDEALIAWRELDHDARPRYEALRAQLEAALPSAPLPPMSPIPDARVLDPIEPPPGAYVTFEHHPRPPRIKLHDPRTGRTLVDITIEGGRVCASYDIKDLDRGAQVLFDLLAGLAVKQPLPDRPDHSYDGCPACVTWRQAGGELVLPPSMPADFGRSGGHDG